MSYIVYNTTTGKILHTLAVSNLDNLDRNIPEGASIILGDIDPNFGYVDLNTSPHSLVELDQAAKDRYILRPSYRAEWDVFTGTWVDMRGLAEYKASKVLLIKTEGLTRITQIFPAMSSIDEIKLLREFYLSIAPSARQPTANFQKIIDISQAVQTALTSVNNAASKAAVDAVSVAWPT
jgi:hypothetical protein